MESKVLSDYKKLNIEKNVKIDPEDKIFTEQNNVQENKNMIQQKANKDFDTSLSVKKDLISNLESQSIIINIKADTLV